MKDLIYRHDAIEAVGGLVSTMSVCANKDECDGMNWMKKRALSALENVHSQTPWIMVSVCDREILVEIFDTYEDAREARDREMVEWAGVPEDVFGKDEYEESDFGYGRYQAFANDKSDYDWLIFCL